MKPSQSKENGVLLRNDVERTTPCVACTRLKSGQMALVNQLVSQKLATYSAVFNPTVTHMIVTVDDQNCLKDYTVKFVAAVAAGIWVLRLEWVQECLNHNCLVPEVSFFFICTIN